MKDVIDYLMLFIRLVLFFSSCAEVAVLSNLTQVFGLLDSIKRILAVRRQMTDVGQKQVLRKLTSE